MQNETIEETKMIGPVLMPATLERDDRPPRGSKRLVNRLLEIRDEYLERGLRPAGAWAEVLEALRDMDRRNETGGQR